jgi:hypothetical protein
MIFYVKVGRSSFLRGASRKASIAHLCTPPWAPPPPATSHHEHLCITNGTTEAFSSQAGMYCRCIIISLCVLQKESLVLIDFSWRKVIFRIRDHVLSCSYDCNDSSLSLPRALFVVLLFSRSFDNKNGRVCCIFQWEKSLCSFIVVFDIMPSFEFHLFLWCCQQWNVWLASFLLLTHLSPALLYYHYVDG